MATVHPSRMALVPQDPKDVYQDRRSARSPSPPRRYDRDRKARDRERPKAGDRESDNDSERGRGRGNDRERSGNRRDRQRDRHYDRTSPRRMDDRDRDRDRGEYRERERDDDRDRDRDRSRRASPEYGDYKRPASPSPAMPSMYPNRPPRDGLYERRGGYGGAGSEYLESRRTQRESSKFSIWPSSPKAPARALSPERGPSRKKSKRDRSETPIESSDSESERRRRERKARKRARKEERRERKERRRRSRSYDDGSEDEEPSRERHRERRSKSRSQPSPSPSPVSSSRASVDEGEWVEKPVAVTPFVVTSQSNPSMPPPATIPSHTKKQTEQDSDSDSDSDVEVGPQPLMKMITSKKVDERAYGGALLRGEGSAMAAFLKDDTQTRIPRRGEIGLTSDEIAQFEAVGYVMSGSRHKRMNAVRMRKENQVISAEEKRGILKLQKEERERRETILREEFSELVHEKLKAKGAETKRMVT